MLVVNVTFQEACAVYWPGEGETAYGEFKVDITGKEECPWFTVRKLVVSDSKVCILTLSGMHD